MIRHRRGRQPGLPLILLGMQMAQYGLSRIPPVTLSVIGAQVAIFLRLIDISWPSIMEVCISPVTVWYREGYTRLILAAFFHVDDWHLYYNMASFLWKGISLEKRLGSGYFIYMLAVFTILCNTLTVGLAMLAEQALHDPSYLSQCAVGFSGVIFALKVVTTHMMPPGTQRVMGFLPVNSRIACWVELVVIQLLVPNASFIGHLAGILVGMAYCKGPLKTLMNLFIVSPPSYTYVSAPTGSSQNNTGYGSGYGTGYTGSGYTSGYAQNRPAHSYFTRSRSRTSPAEDFTGGLSEEEQLQRAMHESLADSQPQSHHQHQRAEPSAPPGDSYSTQNTDTGPPYPTQDTVPPPPYPSSQPQSSTTLYPDLLGVQNQDRDRNQRQSGFADADEVRRRRLARFS